MAKRLTYYFAHRKTNETASYCILSDKVPNKGQAIKKVTIKAENESSPALAFPGRVSEGTSYAEKEILRLDIHGGLTDTVEGHIYLSLRAAIHYVSQEGR